MMNRSARLGFVPARSSGVAAQALDGQHDHAMPSSQRATRVAKTAKSLQDPDPGATSQDLAGRAQVAPARVVGVGVVAVEGAGDTSLGSVVDRLEDHRGRGWLPATAAT